MLRTGSELFCWITIPRHNSNPSLSWLRGHVLPYHIQSTRFESQLPLGRQFDSLTDKKHQENNKDDAVISHKLARVCVSLFVWGCACVFASLLHNKTYLLFFLLQVFLKILARKRCTDIDSTVTKKSRLTRIQGFSFRFVSQQSSKMDSMVLILLCCVGNGLAYCWQPGTHEPQRN